MVVSMSAKPYALFRGQVLTEPSIFRALPGLSLFWNLEQTWTQSLQDGERAWVTATAGDLDSAELKSTAVEFRQISPSLSPKFYL
jgi:hypothetical protein